MMRRSIFFLSLLCSLISVPMRIASLALDAVRIITDVWLAIPKLNDELGGIRYINDRIRYIYSSSRYEYSISLVLASHANQYVLMVRDKKRKRAVSTTIFEFYNNQIHSILRGFLVTMGVYLARINLRYRQKL